MTSNLKSESDHNQNYGTIEDNSKNEAQKAKGNKKIQVQDRKGCAKNDISLNWRETDHTVILEYFNIKE